MYVPILAIRKAFIIIFIKTPSYLLKINHQLYHYQNPLSVSLSDLLSVSILVLLSDSSDERRSKSSLI